MAQFGNVLDKFGVVWAHFGVLLDNFGITKTPKNSVFDTKNKEKYIFTANNPFSRHPNCAMMPRLKRRMFFRCNYFG